LLVGFLLALVKFFIIVVFVAVLVMIVVAMLRARRENRSEKV
jgi:heme/copper-type cytochrome/quinol oxidase subunit 2